MLANGRTLQAQVVGLLILFLGLKMVSAEEMKTNLVKNPDLEVVNPLNSSSPQYWEPHYSNCQWVKEGRENGYCLKIGPAKWSFWQQDISLRPDTTYKLSLWMKGDIPGVVARVAFYRSYSGGTYEKILIFPKLTTYWKEYCQTFTTPSDTPGAALIWLLSAQRKGNIYFDSICLVEVGAKLEERVEKTSLGTIAGKDFAGEDNWGLDSGKNQAVLTYSRERFKKGNRSLKLVYNTKGGKDSLVSISKNIELIIGKPVSIGMWVWGDGSGNKLFLGLKDSTDETFQYRFSPFEITGEGWRYVEANFKNQNPQLYPLIDLPIASMQILLSAGEKNKGILYFNGWELKSQLLPEESFLIKFSTPRKYNIFFDDEEIMATLNIEPLTSERISLPFSLKACDFQGNTLMKKEMNLDVAPTKKRKIPLDLSSLGKNYFRFHYRLGNQEEKKGPSFAVLRKRDVPAKPDIYFGMNSHGMGLERMYLAEICGIRCLRVGLGALVHLDKKGNYDWSRLDEFLQEARNHHFTIYGVEGDSPKPGGGTIHPKNDSEGCAAFIGDLVNHCKGKVKYWEINNEPDVVEFRPSSVKKTGDYWNFLKPNAKEYTRFLKLAYTAAKKADPSCEVMNAGLIVGFTRRDNWIFLDEMYKLGAKDYFDIFAWHPYPRPRGTSPEEGELYKYFGLLRKRMVMYKDDLHKPIWITEFGYPTEEPLSENTVSEELEAAYLVRSFVILRPFPGLEHFGYFCFRDWADEYHKSYDPGGWMGILRRDSTPKPSYVAYATMSYFLENAQYVEKEFIPEPIYSYTFRQGEKMIVVLWNPKDRRRLITKIDANMVKVYNLMGELLPPVNGGYWEFNIGPYPIYLEVNIPDYAHIKKLLKNGVNIF